MKRQPMVDDSPYRSFLVPYDPANPDPRIPPGLIRYIESRQPGLTPRDIAKLDEIEWFTYHTFLKGLNEFAIPGLRPQKGSEVRYVKRYSTKKYSKMMQEFLAYIPDDFPVDQVGRCFMPGYRLTCPRGYNFYPVEFNGDLLAWRKRLADNAAHFATSIGFFEHGRFVVSDGREIEFADMSVANTTRAGIPSNF